MMTDTPEKFAEIATLLRERQVKASELQLIELRIRMMLGHPENTFESSGTFSASYDVENGKFR